MVADAFVVVAVADDMVDVTALLLLLLLLMLLLLLPIVTHSTYVVANDVVTDVVAVVYAEIIIKT